MLDIKVNGVSVSARMMLHTTCTGAALRVWEGLVALKVQKCACWPICEQASSPHRGASCACWLNLPQDLDAEAVEGRCLSTRAVSPGVLHKV